MVRSCPWHQRNLCLYMIAALVGSYCVCIFFQISESAHYTVLWFLVQVGCIGFYIFCTELPSHSKSIVNLRIDENVYCWDNSFQSDKIYRIIFASMRPIKKGEKKSFCSIEFVLGAKNLSIVSCNRLIKIQQKRNVVHKLPKVKQTLFHLMDAPRLLIWVCVFPIENDIISLGSWSIIL